MNIAEVPPLVWHKLAITNECYLQPIPTGTLSCQGLGLDEAELQLR